MDYDPLFWEKFFWLIKYPESITFANIIHEILVYLLVILLFVHGYRKYGLKKILIFLSGGFLFAGLEENMMILAGYELNGMIILGSEFPMTYYFNYQHYILWFMAVPVIAACGWFILTYTSVQITQKLWTGFVKSALAGAFIATSMDLLIDPVMIRKYNWIWLAEQPEILWVLQVPISNFIGWFLLIFSFNCIFYWYWDKYMKKKENWSNFKSILVFYLFMYGILIAVEFVILSLSVALVPLYGIDLSWWSFPT